MKKHYCHSCASSKKLIKIDVNFNLSGSSYLLKKFIKHTIPSNKRGNISVFDVPNYDNYKNHIINTAASGSIEEYDNGTINYVYYAGKTTGFYYENGILIEPNDAVKIVLPNDIERLHAYPTSSLQMKTAICSECGKSILV